MRFKGNGSRRSRLLPFFLCAVRVAVDLSLSVGNACDRFVNGSLPLGVEGEALLLGLGLIGGLQLGNVDIIEVHAQILELGDGIIIGLIEQVTLILDALLNGGKERLAKILRNLVPRIVAHAEDDVNEGVLGEGDVLGDLIIAGVEAVGRCVLAGIDRALLQRGEHVVVVHGNGQWRRRIRTLPGDTCSPWCGWSRP